jgi:hypothetical protein
MAAVLSSGPRAVLSHRSAAALWGLRGYSERRVEVTTPHKSTSSKLVQRHQSPVPEDEITVEDGIPVTTVPRTIFDLAAVESTEVIQNLLREAEFRHLWDRLSLRDLVEHYPGKRGVRAVRTALERLNCHWPEAEQIVELDGWEAHRTRTAFREDRARDRRLRGSRLLGHASDLESARR